MEVISHAAIVEIDIFVALIRSQKKLMASWQLWYISRFEGSSYQNFPKCSNMPRLVDFFDSDTSTTTESQLPCSSIQGCLDTRYPIPSCGQSSFFQFSMAVGQDKPIFSSPVGFPILLMVHSRYLLLNPHFCTKTSSWKYTLSFLCENLHLCYPSSSIVWTNPICAMVKTWVASRLKLPRSEVGGVAWRLTNWAMELTSGPFFQMMKYLTLSPVASPCHYRVTCILTDLRPTPAHSKNMSEKTWKIIQNYRGPSAPAAYFSPRLFKNAWSRRWAG